MELNCLLFPSKKKVNVDSIASKIVLIPHQEHLKHIYYQKFINPGMVVKDELSQRIKPRKVIQVPISISEQMRKLGDFKRNVGMESNKRERNEECSFQQLKNSLIKTNPLNPHTITIQPPIELMSLPISNKQQHSPKPETSPSTEASTKVRGYIPCLFLPGTQKFIFYFHGNAQDIKSSSEFLKYIHKATGKSVFAIQYEGYSIYQGSPSAQKIQKDILIVTNYLMRMGLNLQNVFVIGRSIGSGPALSLVSQFKVAGIMLVSPFLSICKLVRDKYGTVAYWLIKERFQNYKMIELIDAPIFILHGTDDTIIPHSHSEMLCELSKNRAELLLVQGMTHMSFDFRNDFMLPLEAFFAKIKF